jgi:hypothetical protein
MLSAHPHAGEGFQLLEMLLPYEKYDEEYVHQIHGHRVHLKCGARYVTKDLDLLVHPVPRAGSHLDVC